MQQHIRAGASLELDQRLIRINLQARQEPRKPPVERKYNSLRRKISEKLLCRLKLIRPVFARTGRKTLQIRHARHVVQRLSLLRRLTDPLDDLRRNGRIIDKIIMRCLCQKRRDYIVLRAVRTARRDDILLVLEDHTAVEKLRHHPRKNRMCVRVKAFRRLPHIIHLH